MRIFWAGAEACATSNSKVLRPDALERTPVGRGLNEKGSEARPKA
jgi:hypothetical protein